MLAPIIFGMVISGNQEFVYCMNSPDRSSQMTKQIKKILIISGTYPPKMNSQLGSFVKESVDTIKELWETDIYLAVSRSLPFNNFLVFIKYIRIIARALYICVVHRPQFIIAHTIFPAGFFSVLIAKLFKIKIVVFAHGGSIIGLSKTNAVLWDPKKMNLLWRIRYRLIQLVLNKADGIIYVSDYLFDIAQKYFKTNASKSLISPVGYNPNIFHTNTQFEDREKAILYVGRIDEKKGIYKLFDMLASISDYLTEENFVVKVAGRVDDGEFFNKMNDLNEVLNIEYLGELGRNELARIYNSSLITIVPSFFESFGLVAIESLACGTPVASYPVGGLLNIITENHNGIFLNPENDQASGDKLMQLLQNQAALKIFSQNSESSVEKYDIYSTHKNDLEFIDNIYNNEN